MSCNTQAIVSRISPSGVTRQAMDVSVNEDVGLRCANPTYAAKPQVLGLPPGYAEWLTQLKGRIAQARQAEQGSGAKVINRLAHDLKEAFPDMRGFSTRNLKYMAYFAEHCPAGLIGQQPAAQLPWFHIVTLLTKLVDLAEREQNRLVAQYALSGIDKPIGVAEYQLLRELPETLVSSLPGIDEIEAEFGDKMEGIDEE